MSRVARREAILDGWVKHREANPRASVAEVAPALGITPAALDRLLTRRAKLGDERAQRPRQGEPTLVRDCEVCGRPTVPESQAARPDVPAGAVRYGGLGQCKRCYDLGRSGHETREAREEQLREEWQHLSRQHIHISEAARRLDTTEATLRRLTA